MKSRAAWPRPHGLAWKTGVAGPPQSELRQTPLVKRHVVKNANDRRPWTQTVETNYNALQGTDSYLLRNHDISSIRGL
jgi:hypothetical protein